jgi:U3 small nucleolar RNA-associated protein 4
MQKVIHEEVEEETALILDSGMDVDGDGDSDSLPDLSLLRRGSRDDGGKSAKGKGKKGEAKPSDWHTFKYRPIMGVVLIGEGEREGGVGPEVAVVERPAWEAGLPGRWEGEQEWRDREVGL